MTVPNLNAYEMGERWSKHVRDVINAGRIHHRSESVAGIQRRIAKVEEETAAWFLARGINLVFKDEATERRYPMRGDAQRTAIKPPEEKLRSND